MKRLMNLWAVLSMLLILVGCGGAMNLNVDTLPLSSQYGYLAPRVSADNCKYYSKENAPDPSTYTVLAQYIIQETPTVITSQSALSMICYAYEIGVEKGADAVIVDEMSTTNVAGGYARTSPIVKVRAIRFKGQPPMN